jgi:hypothetical protein
MFTMLGTIFGWWLQVKSRTCLVHAFDNYEVLTSNYGDTMILLILLNVAFANITMAHCDSIKLISNLNMQVITNIHSNISHYVTSQL